MYYVLTSPNFFAVTRSSPYGTILADNFTVHELEGDIPDLNVSDWNYDTEKFIESSAKITKLKFQNRFTLQERIAIRGSTDPIVIDIMALLDAAEYVDLSDPQTQQGIGYLSMVGLITAQRAQEILT